MRHCASLLALLHETDLLRKNGEGRVRRGSAHPSLARALSSRQVEQAVR